MLPVNNQELFPINKQEQLKSEINSINNLDSWGNWDNAVVSDSRLEALLADSFLSLKKCPDISLSLLLIDLSKRIESEQYVGTEVKKLATQIGNTVDDCFSLIRGQDLMPVILNYLHSRENRFVTDKPSTGTESALVSKGWNSLVNDQKNGWGIDHNKLWAESQKVQNCKDAEQAIDLIIKDKLSVADLSKFPDLTDDHLDKLFKEGLNIDHLMIFSPLITKLPAACSRLQTLHCPNCELLTALPDLPNVTQLNCSFCPLLTALPAQLPNLTKLYCNDCPLITALPAQLPNLTKLYCNDCPLITALPDLPKVTVLYCFGCSQLTALPDLPKVTELNCFGCSLLTALPAQLPNVIKLSCDRCPLLTSLPALPNVTMLCCHSCPLLTALPAQLPNLTKLYCYGCPLLIALPAHLPKATIIDCSGCPLINNATCTLF